MDQFITLAVLITAAAVVTSTSTVFSVLWLVATFILVSILLGLLNLGLPALLYIIVYVGAIAILFLFVIQLLDLGGTSKNSAANYSFFSANFILAILISLIIICTYFNLTIPFVPDFNSLFSSSANLNVLSLNLNVNDTSHNLYLSLLFNSNAVQVAALAQWLYGPGLIALIIISLILLIAMIAPISLCKDQSID